MTSVIWGGVEIMRVSHGVQWSHGLFDADFVVSYCDESGKEATSVGGGGCCPASPPQLRKSTLRNLESQHLAEQHFQKLERKNKRNEKNPPQEGKVGTPPNKTARGLPTFEKRKREKTISLRVWKLRQVGKPLSTKLPKPARGTTPLRSVGLASVVLRRCANG